MPENETEVSSCLLKNRVSGWIGIALAMSPMTLFAAPQGDGGTSTGPCDAAQSQTLVNASPSRFEARAYWLSGRLIQWPGVEPTDRFRLYHSLKGRIVANAGSPVTGADGALTLVRFQGRVPPAVATRFKYVAPGPLLRIQSADTARLRAIHERQLVLVQEDAAGTVRNAAALQSAGALDDLFAAAANVTDLGVGIARGQTRFKVWAPTARAVSACLYDTGSGKATARMPLRRDAATGTWSLIERSDLSGRYYTYLVDVFANGVGRVRNRVTDPYSISLGADSKRSYIADLDAAKLKPIDWDAGRPSSRVQAQTDMVIYELHVRDFSINDASVTAANRGKYLAFTEPESLGMKHLAALSDAGLTDVHLLPVFDFATVPEAGCTSGAGNPNAVPSLPGAADSDAQQAAVAADAAGDCFNWGYDPYHFSAPEGSYASDASDGAARIVEFRRMVMALHRAGLRVGMDVVYNHTTASGQQEKSVLDRIVPGYYHRLDASGAVERSTCCENTATENMMMAKLMIDSVALWAKQYRIDSFRFDLMGHQPRAVMEALKTRVDTAAGRNVNLIGEGWNFGEVANGSRFVQASQLSLNGSGIGTFSDRARDALRGGGHGDSGEKLVANQGYLNGLVYDPNAMAGSTRPASDLLKAADLVRAGLAGSLRGYSMTTRDGTQRRLDEIDYAGQPAGYASRPDEVVNYVENHDNHTLFDINAFRLPVATSREDRARVQMLGVATTAFSQGIAYFHAGIDLLRSKSMDANSFDSGDWFNRIDWSGQDNYFGTGLPPKADNGAQYAFIAPLLANPDLKPAPGDIALARGMFRDLIRIRASTTLFRMRTAADIQSRLVFFNTGPAQVPTVIAAHIDGRGYPGGVFRELVYFINVDKQAHVLTLATERNKDYRLHPVHRSLEAADRRPAAEARYEPSTGRFTLPPRTALVFAVAE